MNQENETELIKQKAKVFFEKKSMTHLALHDYAEKRAWANGVIKELSDEFIILDEREDGDLLIFFKEIRKIEFFNWVKK